MKCPKCSVQHKKKEGITCKCGYRFTFEPQRDGMTDGRFLAAVRAVSANDTYYFTLNGLQAELCRRSSKGPLIPLLVSGGLVAVLLFVVFTEGPMYLAIIMGVGALIALGVAVYRVFSNTYVDLQEVEKFVKSFRNSPLRDQLDKLILTPGMHDPPPEWSEKDIYDYGVERLLIVEHDLLVDLFVRNGFHAEQRSLVLAESGYPQYLVKQAAKVLRENPELPVYFLHDATPHGEQLAQRVRQEGLLPIKDHPQFDLGLNSADVKRMKGMRAIGADHWTQGVPIDALRYGTLGLGVGLALAEQQSLGALLEASQKKGADDGSSTGGFG